MTPRLGIEKIVEEILRKDKESRGDERILIWAVYRRLNVTTEERVGLFQTSSYITWEDFKDSPPLESITRSIRKVKERHPELKHDYAPKQKIKRLADKIKLTPRAY